MKSTIRIALNGENVPVIRCVLDQSSTDLKDDVLQRFKERFGYDSYFCRVEFWQSTDPSEKDIRRFDIVPVSPKELKEFEGLVMDAAMRKSSDETFTGSSASATMTIKGVGQLVGLQDNASSENKKSKKRNAK